MGTGNTNLIESRPARESGLARRRIEPYQLALGRYR
jgi:hypothetical protein